MFLILFIYPALISPPVIAFFDDALFKNFKDKINRTVKTDIEKDKDFDTFKDPEFKNPSSNFSPGEIVYFRVKTPGGGERKKVLRLLDKDKNEIRKLILTQEGKGPFMFTTSFKAPATSGVYYLNVKIEDGKGFNFAGERNINIKNEEGASVASEAKSVVSQEKKDNLVGPTSFFQEDFKSQPAEKEQTSQESFKKSFFEGLLLILKNFLSRIFKT